MTRQMNAGANRRLSCARLFVFLSASLLPLSPLLFLSFVHSCCSRVPLLPSLGGRRGKGCVNWGVTADGCVCVCVGLWAARVSLDWRSEGFNDGIWISRVRASKVHPSTSWRLLLERGLARRGPWPLMMHMRIRHHPGRHRSRTGPKNGWGSIQAIVGQHRAQRRRMDDQVGGGGCHETAYASGDFETNSNIHTTYLRACKVTGVCTGKVHPYLRTVKSKYPSYVDT